MKILIGCIIFRTRNKDTDNCHANATCTNTDGSFTCACDTGYSGDGVTCTDDDECILDTAGCDANATCTNTDGSFYCTCDTGYEGDGFNCTNIDECLTLNPCDQNATCTDSDGSYSCYCDIGYSGNGFNCTDDDECGLETDRCHDKATCSNTEVSVL